MVIVGNLYCGRLVIFLRCIIFHWVFIQGVIKNLLVIKEEGRCCVATYFTSSITVGIKESVVCLQVIILGLKF